VLRVLPKLGTHPELATPETLDQMPGLDGGTVVSSCNSAFLANAKRLRELGCRLVWGNCMSWLFDAERKFYRECGPREPDRPTGGGVR